MSFKEAVKREGYVVAYGQSWRFRAVKYAVLVPLFFAVYWFFGAMAFWYTLLGLVLLGVAVHVALRYLTHGWRDAWGPYTPLDFKE